MEKTKPTPATFATNYGLILGIIMIVIALIMYYSGMMLEGKQWPMFLYYLIFPITILYSINQFKKQNANLLSLSEALKVGILIALISALVYSVYNLLFNYAIDPEFIDKMIRVTEDKLLENSNIPPEIAEQQIEWVKKLSNPILGSAFWIGLSLFFGLIYSLIGGLVMKKSNA